jgi:hypothetical protein
MQAKWIFLISFFVAWSAFTWWTVRHVLRKVRAREDESLATNAVLVVLMTAFIAFRFPITMPMPPFEYWQLVGFWAFYSFPTCIWILYLTTKLLRSFVSWKYREKKD